MRIMISMGLAWMVAAGAVAAEDPVPLLPSPLVFPRHIGPMVLAGEPHRYDDARLGVSYQYSGSGLSLTVYVYDAGQKELPDGADTIPSCQEFENAKQSVEQSYQKVQLKSQVLARLTPPDALPQVREALYEYEREGKSAISFIWVTTVAKNFVKLRMSMNPRLRDEVPDARRAVLSALGEAVKPHLAPVDPDAKPPGTTLNVNVDGGPMKEMAMGLGYLAILIEAIEKFPEMAPVCGGQFTPDYETELGAYQGMMQMNSESPDKPIKKLAQVEKAGFLEEFVWVELHRDFWGTTPPEGLALPEYQAWKKKNLKRFKPTYYGHVVVDHPRPMPPEPPAP
jgi:hypothetical protein